MSDKYQLGHRMVPKPLTHRVYAHYRYPQGVKGVYDNGGKTQDRYTVVYCEYVVWGGTRLYDCYGLDEAPCSPQGFVQHSTCALGAHLGRRIAFEDLPEACRELVKRDLVHSKKGAAND